MPRAERDRQGETELGRSSKTNGRPWADAIGTDLLIEFIDDGRAFMRPRCFRDGVLHGAQLVFSPRSLRFEENGMNMAVHEKHIRRVSAVRLGGAGNATTFPCVGSVIRL